MDNRQIRQNIEAAVKTTQRYLSFGVDGLCCGVLGKIEFLLTTAQKMSRPDLLAKVSASVAKVVRGSHQRGYFFYGNSLHYNPCFLQGDTGIGYELLRLSYPDRLSSVLILEIE